MKIAITGANGFIGKSLLNHLIYKFNFDIKKIILIEKEDFKNCNQLKIKLKNCDIIFHFAGVNRHDDSGFLYEENIRLSTLLVKNISKNTKTIIFASSIQQNFDNPFGKSKLKCKQIFDDWAIKNKSSFINLKIPNVFGPFGKPNYNSFIATFCYNLVNNIKCKANNDNDINLLYIDDCISKITSTIFKIIDSPNEIFHQEISNFEFLENSSVNKILNILKNQWYDYTNNIIPNISSKLEYNLFNTLRSFIDYNHYFPVCLKKNKDQRGFFSEIIKTKGQGQFSISTSMGGVTRGNHFHTRKIERFIVTQGTALVKLRKIDSKETFSFILNGNNLDFIDIPIWYTHNIKNIGDDILLTLFWINEFYNPNNTDTYFLEV
jgi:UDP-2-acetamido-2,6-beta-L-arabino-hexul-4-ose reductase